MDQRLAKIRSQLGSKLQNQNQYALVLLSVEESLKNASDTEDSASTATPTAYFVSFISLLDQCSKDGVLHDLKLAADALYFLDIVAQDTPKRLLRENFSDILLKLAPALSSKDADAPLIRPAIGLLQSLLLAQDLAAWKNSSNFQVSPKRAFSIILQLSLDPRPKIRKRALEAVSQVLGNPPPSPILGHPIGNFSSGFALQKLATVAKGFKKAVNPNSSNLIHVLQLINAMASTWPLKDTPNLCDALLDICKSNDQYLISSVFSVFESLFQSANAFGNDDESYDKILEIILGLKPAINDPHLVPAWLAVVSKGVSSEQNSNRLIRLPNYFTQISQYFNSTIPSINESVSQCLISIIVNCIPDQNLIDLNSDTKSLLEFLSTETNNLLNVKYRHAARDVCNLVIEMFNKFKFRAHPYLVPQLELIGGWRSIEQDEFELNGVAESVIGAAVSNIGLEHVLEVLPLNLTDSKAIGRAWLLPILRDNIKFGSSLDYFVKTLLPNVEFFKEKISHCSPTSINAKVFQTIVDQIWSLFPQICYLPIDLQSTFTDEFGSNLGTLLFQEPNLRPVICNGLKNLITSLIDRCSIEQGEDKFLEFASPLARAKSDLEYLTNTQASKILSVLFNVFSSTPIAQRGFVSETIESYLQISNEDDLLSTFNNVCSLLKENLEKEKDLDKHDIPLGKNKMPKLSVTMLDLIVLIIKFIPENCHLPLLAIFNETVRIQDVQIQKRSYRVILKLLELENKPAIEEHLLDILKLFIETTDLTLVAAKPQRLESILILIQLLPVNLLYFIPVIIPEIIISTKSNNETTRTSSYAIIIAIGKKLDQFNGEIIQNSIVDPEIPDSQASIKEFFTICSAGLVGSTPHMISAAVTALSCLFYEFGKDLSVEDQMDLFSNILLFLQSNNREIIKPCLGFIKVSLMVIDEDLIKAKLSEILTDLMIVNKEQKNHFKSKIKHLIEKFIRKFGFDLIEENIPQDDLKLIHAIKKAKNKSKSELSSEEKSSSSSNTNGTISGVNSLSAYDKVLYEDSDDEEFEEQSSSSNSRNGKKVEHFISEGNDMPLDLLDKDAMSKISTKKTSGKFTKKHLHDAKTKNGKLVFNENDDNEDDDLLSGGNALDAYVEAVNQGPVRNARNKLKWKKKTSGDDGINWDDESEDVGKRGVDKLNKKSNFNSNSKSNSRISKPKFKSRRKL